MHDILINICTLLVGLAILLIPLFIIKKKSKIARLKHFDERLKHIASDKSFSVSKPEIIGNTIFDYDETKKAVIILAIRKDAEECHVINSDQVARCSVETIIRDKETFELRLNYSTTSHHSSHIVLYRKFRDNETHVPRLLLKAKEIEQILNA